MVENKTRREMFWLTVTICKQMLWLANFQNSIWWKLLELIKQVLQQEEVSDRVSDKRRVKTRKNEPLPSACSQQAVLAVRWTRWGGSSLVSCLTQLLSRMQAQSHFVPRIVLWLRWSTKKSWSAWERVFFISCRSMISVNRCFLRQIWCSFGSSHLRPMTWS